MDAYRRFSRRRHARTKGRCVHEASRVTAENAARLAVRCLECPDTSWMIVRLPSWNMAQAVEMHELEFGHKLVEVRDFASRRLS